MGNALKRIATKPFRSFNIENRARRAIERKKPIQAPRHSGFKDATPPEMQGLRNLKALQFQAFL